MTWSRALRRYQGTAAGWKRECADAHSFAEKHTAPIQRNVQTRPFYAAHLSHGRSRLCDHNRAARRSALLDSPLASPLTWWLYLVSGLISVDSALVLFLSRPLSVLSSPPLTGARASDHSWERTIGSGPVTWPPRRGSALRGDTRSREYGISRKGSRVKSSSLVRLEVLAGSPFSSASSSSMVMEEKQRKNGATSQTPYCPLLAGYCASYLCFFGFYGSHKYLTPRAYERKQVHVGLYLCFFSHPSIMLLF